MRQKRAKIYRRAMHLYHRSFGFREPYQVLLDPSFVQAAVDFKMDLAHILKTVLQGEVKPMITQCCIETLYRLGREYQNVVDVAKMAERRKCNHREPLRPEECLKSVVMIKVDGAAGDADLVENKHRYIVGTQDQDLRQTFRELPGVPLLYLKRSVLVLEPVSQGTKDHLDKIERGKRNPFEEELALFGRKEIDTVQTAIVTADGEETGVPTNPAKPTKRKRAKGPNPLSMKKPKQRSR